MNTDNDGQELSRHGRISEKSSTSDLLQRSSAAKMSVDIEKEIHHYEYIADKGITCHYFLTRDFVRRCNYCTQWAIASWSMDDVRSDTYRPLLPSLCVIKLFMVARARINRPRKRSLHWILVSLLFFSRNAVIRHRLTSKVWLARLFCGRFLIYSHFCLSLPTNSRKLSHLLCSILILTFLTVTITNDQCCTYME